jgi:predicted DNA-binding ribbon-helix-helix protein
MRGARFLFQARLPGDPGTDLGGLVVKLKNAEDPLSEHIRGRFLPETRLLVESYDASSPPSKALRQAIRDEFVRLEDGPLLYDRKRFAQVALPDETEAAIEQRPEGEALARLNHLLLENGYPAEILRELSAHPKVPVSRVQTGIRIEKRMLKVLKALAEHHDHTLGELVESIVLHALAGVPWWDAPADGERIAALMKVYGMDYDMHAGHRFVESSPPSTD